MKKFELQGPDGKIYEVEAPDEGAALEAFRRIMPAPEKNETLNTLRIAGTGAIQGATDTANIPSAVASVAGETAAGLNKMQGELSKNGETTLPMQGIGFGGSPLGAFLKSPKVKIDPNSTVAKDQANAASKWLDVRPFVENKMGLPTDPEKEAKRLGAEMTPLRKALATGARFGTSAATMGAGLPLAVASAVGAGAGEYVGGDTGALVGSMLGPVGLARNAAKRSLKAAEKSAPTVDARKAEASALYKGSGADEAIIGAPSIDSAVERIKKMLADEAYHPKAHKETAAALRVLEDTAKRARTVPDSIQPSGVGLPAVATPPAATGITLKGAEVIRDIVRDQGLGLTVKPGDKRLIRAMVREWDESTRGLTNKDAIQGDLEKAVADYKTADKIWGQAKRGERVQQAIDTAATRGGTATDKALRNEFGALVREMNKKGWPGWSAAEKAAAIEMAEPNMVRKIVGGVGYAPIFAPLYSKGTNKLAENMATKNAERLRNMILRGAPAEMSPTAASMLARALVNSPAAALTKD